MSVAPVVTATLDKPSYVQGDTVVVTFSVAADTRDDPRTHAIVWSGHDDEGNTVDGSTATTVHVTVADSFTLDSVAWEGGASFTVVGLVATGTA